MEHTLYTFDFKEFESRIRKVKNKFRLTTKFKGVIRRSNIVFDKFTEAQIAAFKDMKKCYPTYY